MDGSTESGSSTHDVLEIWPRRSWRTDRPASFTVKKLRWLGESLNLTGRSLEKLAHGSSAGHRLISRGLGEFANTFITLE